MLFAAGLSAVALVALLTVGASRLAAARFPSRSPSAALVLWQALGLSTGLLALEVAATVALAPLGDTHRQALTALVRDRGRPSLPWWALLAAVAGLLVLVRLVQVLLRSTVLTVRARRRNRVLVDLVATRNPLLRGTHVVDHAVPVAYCLPGLRPRVVLSRGALTALAEDEVRAVLDHELAHVVQRHDLVVLPFVALRTTFPWLPAVRRAEQQVGLLVEMLADDHAARRHDARALARALCKVGSGQAPPGGFAATGPPAGGPYGDGRGPRPGGRAAVGAPAAPDAADPYAVGGAQVLTRAQRLLTRPVPLGILGVALVLATAAAVALLPALAILLPLVPSL